MAFRALDTQSARRVPGPALAVGLVLYLCALGCEQSQRAPQGEGPGHRQQPLGLTAGQELQVGREAYRQELAKYRGELLPSDSREVQRVRHVAGRIVHAAGIEPLQREMNLRLRGYRFEWVVNVARNRQVNAFCLPGGKIMVFTGILHVVQNDDQLATVLSHEIAHALAHHASERVAWDDSGRVTGLRKKAYSRAQESEADHIGVFLMTFAGYDPHQAIVFWRYMQRLEEENGWLPEILSDHPSGEHRVHDLEQWVPQALAGKRAYDERRIAPAARR
jgi:predicted Zn-dependent protease